MKKLSILLLLTILCLGCKSNAQKEKDQSDKIAANKPDRLKGHKFPVQKSNAEWKKELTPEQYYVLREAGTEKPRSSKLLHIKGKGIFVCGACGNPVYRNENQFVSGTGWPSFDRPIKKGVVLATDTKLGYKRNEVLCSRCGGHLGHRFNDGPRETTGLRYCMNGDAMKFVQAEDKTEDQIIENHQLKNQH